MEIAALHPVPVKRSAEHAFLKISCPVTPTVDPGVVLSLVGALLPKTTVHVHTVVGDRGAVEGGELGERVFCGAGAARVAGRSRKIAVIRC